MKECFFEGQKINIPNTKSIGDPIGKSKLIQEAISDKLIFLYLYFINIDESSETKLFLVRNKINPYTNKLDKEKIVLTYGEEFSEKDLSFYDDLHAINGDSPSVRTLSDVSFGNISHTFNPPPYTITNPGLIRSVPQTIEEFLAD